MPEPLPLNRMLLVARINDVREQLGVLRQHAAATDAAFLQDRQAIRSARYAFIVLVEAAAAICAHLCARRLSTAPETYADCFRRLGAGGIIAPELVSRLGAMARLRNLVVHVYGEVDDAHFLRILRNDLADVDTYLDVVLTLLAGEGGQ